MLWATLNIVRKMLFWFVSENTNLHVNEVSEICLVEKRIFSRLVAVDVKCFNINKIYISCRKIIFVFRIILTLMSYYFPKQFNLIVPLIEIRFVFYDEEIDFLNIFQANFVLPRANYFNLTFESP
jgi:hypothetical protein